VGYPFAERLSEPASDQSGQKGERPLLLCGCAAAGVLGVPDHAKLAWISVRRRTLWLIACGVGTFVNPLGLGTIQYVHSVVTSEGVHNSQQWNSLDVLSIAGIATGVSLVLAAMIFTEDKSCRTGVVPVVIFGALAFQAQRNVIWLGLVLLPIIARGFNGIAPDFEKYRLHHPARAIIPLGIAFLATLLALAPGSHAQRGRALAGTPDRLISRLPDNATSFVDLDMADYAYVQRHVPVFIDVRFERFEPAAIRAYIDLDHGKASSYRKLIGCRAGHSVSFLVHRSDQENIIASIAKSSPTQQVSPHVDGRQAGWVLMHSAC